MQDSIGRVAYTLDQEESDILLFHIFILPIQLKNYRS